jgi:hypothetical protein
MIVHGDEKLIIPITVEGYCVKYFTVTIINI